MAKQSERFHPGHREFARLKQRAVVAGIPPDNVQLVDVTDIPTLLPYVDPTQHPDTISDLDNVWVSWSKRSLVENTTTALALVHILRRSRRFSLWSSRICAGETSSVLARRLEGFLQRQTGRMGAFPFFSQDDKNWLQHQTTSVNPDCQLDYELGAGKLRNGNFESFNDRVEHSLKDGPVVLIGSSTFDRRRFTNVLPAVSRSGHPERAFICDTGGIIL